MPKRLSRIVLAIMLMAPIAPALTDLRAEQLTAQAVREAIQRGAAYLTRQQRPDGTWRPEWVGQEGGITALCTLALLNSGVQPEDPAIQRALAYLRRVEPARTYVVSLQTMVLCRAEPHKDLLRIHANVRWLEQQQIASGPNRGGWSYPQGDGDNSNTQFALLALHEAERAGVQVQDRTWRLAKAYWEKCQNPDGSWGYRRGDPGTGSMTCAGLASLVIANDRVEPADARVQGDRILCCQTAQSKDDPVQRGLQWLASHFSVVQNPGRGPVWHLYYMYGLERVGRLTSRRFIGRHDWYREGADWLLRMKGGPLADSWSGQFEFERNGNLATSFALLFLSKGRWPVLISKLKHGPADDWNRHRSDVANLTRQVESRWKRDLVWQVIDLPSATVEDLVQSPVLYFSGTHSPLPETPAAQQELASKLRGYLDRGGFLLAEAICGGQEFDQGFRKLIEQVFPEPEYRLRLLPAEHPIWRAEETVALEHVRPLLGIEFGCRTSVVYSPPDARAEPRHALSCLWELSRPGRQERFSPAVDRQIKAGVALGANILAYATNRELVGREAFFVPRESPLSDDQLDRGRLYVPSLRHLGGCNAAPRALTNLLVAAADQTKLRVGLQPRELALTDPALFDYHLVFMHGRNAFSLTEAERAQLRTFLQRGGMLFANAICASRPFADSFRQEMRKVLPEQPLQPIPAGDPLLTPSFGGFDLSVVTRRDPDPQPAGQPLKAVLRKGPPELEGIRLDSRWAVIFSPDDLSCALEKQETMECRGYTREDAARIGLNVILYSLQQ